MHQFSVALVKHQDPNLWKKGLFWLVVLEEEESIMSGKCGYERQAWGQNQEAGSSRPQMYVQITEKKLEVG